MYPLRPAPAEWAARVSGGSPSARQNLGEYVVGAFSPTRAYRVHSDKRG